MFAGDRPDGQCILFYKMAIQCILFVIAGGRQLRGIIQAGTSVLLTHQNQTPQNLLMEGIFWQLFMGKGS